MRKLLIFLFITFLLSDILAQCPPGTLNSSQELVINGDFSSGNTSFSSSYNYIPGGPILNEGEYAIDTNATNVHPSFIGSDHTTGTGNFMIINGADIPNVSLWCQTISVQPNTVYLFSAWVASMFTNNPASL